MPDVTCLGELLIDFTSVTPGASIMATPAFEKHAGGGPANVAVGVCRLGGSAAFLGMVGNDEFGRYLAGELADRAVDITGLRYSDQAHTTLAFVALRDDGEREFIFYRNPGADMLYAPADVDASLLAAGRVLHHGSISLIAEPNRSATLQAVAIAKSHGRIISFDPNLRLNLWPNAEAAFSGIQLGIPTADLLKVSAEELTFITGEQSIDAGMAALTARGVPVVVVTLGEEGCAYVWGPYRGRVTTTPRPAVDTTGAGDAFVAGLLYGLTRVSTSHLALSHDEVKNILGFANTVAGHVVTKRGAIPAMPTLAELR